jgi:hypothetical protein
MIECNLTSTGFKFTKGKKVVAFRTYDTMKLVKFEEIGEEDQFYLDDAIDSYVPGEVWKSKTGGPDFVLGPKRDFTHEVQLHACGNPDHQQYADIGPKKTVRIVGVEEASTVVKAYQTLHDMGGGNCGKLHGVVWELKKNGKRKRVGRVYYNGRYETNAEIEAFAQELKAKYGSGV